MSRTKRRANGYFKRWFNVSRDYRTYKRGYLYYYNGEYGPVDQEWEDRWHAKSKRDGFDNSSLNKNVKHAAKRRVRASSRKERQHLLLDAEYITQPWERNYRGERWNWD